MPSNSRSALADTLLFGALDEGVIAELADASTVRRYARGQVVIEEGDPGGDVLVVAEGRLRILIRSPEGLDVVLGFAVVGDTIGEVSLFDGAPRAASVEAAENSLVVVVPGSAVRQVIRDHPDLAEEIIRQQAVLIRRSTGMVADLVFLDLPRRVAKFVMERVGPDDRAELGVSQSELAAAVGGVRQSVNAALRGFERRGWVHISGRTVAVRDRDALARYAHVDVP